LNAAAPALVGETCAVRPRVRNLATLYGVALAAVVAYASAAEAGMGDSSVFLPLVAVFVAAAISSVAGFAFAPISAVMLVWLIPEPVQMVAVILAASITIQGFSVWALRRQMAWRGCLRFLAGGLVTLPLGLLLLLTLSGHRHAMALGVLMVAYGGWMLLRPPVPPRTPPGWTAVLAGALGGVTGGMTGFPSAPVTVWGGICGQGRVELRGILQPFIFVMQVASLLLLQVMAPDRGAAAGFDPLLLLVVPPALLGTLCGIGLYLRLSDMQFNRVVNLTLIAAGFGLLL